MQIILKKVCISAYNLHTFAYEYQNHSRMPKIRINITIEESLHTEALKLKEKRYQPTLSSYIAFLIQKDKEQLEQEAKK